MMKRLKYIAVFFIITISSCSKRCIIPIPNTLELSLANEYNSYVDLVNKSCKKDSIALEELVKISNIHDSAAYDHGWILAEVAYHVTDEYFSNFISKLSKKDQAIVRKYFRAGLDYEELEYIKGLKHTLKVLNLSYLLENE